MILGLEVGGSFPVSLPVPVGVRFLCGFVFFCVFLNRGVSRFGFSRLPLWLLPPRQVRKKDKPSRLRSLWRFLEDRIRGLPSHSHGSPGDCYIFFMRPRLLGVPVLHDERLRNPSPPSIYLTGKSFCAFLPFYPFVLMFLFRFFFLVLWVDFSLILWLGFFLFSNSSFFY